MYSSSPTPRVKTFSGMAPKQTAKPRWDAQLPLLALRDFPGQPVEIRPVGSPFCHKLHTIYLNLDDARELKRWHTRDRKLDKAPANIAQNAKAFDVVCPDFDFIDEKSYPNAETGLHSCDCCGTYYDYVKDRLQYFAWCLYKNPKTQQWVPELKVFRFPKTVAEGLQDALDLMTDANGNKMEDIADYDNGGTIIVKYTPGAAPAKQYIVNRGNAFPLPQDMRSFVEHNIKPLDEIYRENMQDPADISRSLHFWKYPELLQDSSTHTQASGASFGSAPSAPSAPSGDFGGAFGGATEGTLPPSIPTSGFDAPPSSVPSHQQSFAASIPTFDVGDSVPAFGQENSVPAFGGEPSFGGGSALPSFMSDSDFPVPQPPQSRRPETSGF